MGTRNVVATIHPVSETRTISTYNPACDTRAAICSHFGIAGSSGDGFSHRDNSRRISNASGADPVKDLRGPTPIRRRIARHAVLSAKAIVNVASNLIALPAPRALGLPAHTKMGFVQTLGDHGLGVIQMLGTILLIILILILLGALPRWPHSAGWGYGPSGAVGVILIIVLILVLLGRI